MEDERLPVSLDSVQAARVIVMAIGVSNFLQSIDFIFMSLFICFYVYVSIPTLKNSFY